MTPTASGSQPNTPLAPVHAADHGHKEGDDSGIQWN